MIFFSIPWTPTVTTERRAGHGDNVDAEENIQDAMIDKDEKWLQVLAKKTCMNTFFHLPHPLDLSNISLILCQQQLWRIRLLLLASLSLLPFFLAFEDGLGIKNLSILLQSQS